MVQEKWVQERKSKQFRTGVADETIEMNQILHKT